MKTYQFIFIWAGICFMAAILISIEQELHRLNNTALIIKDGIDFNAIQGSKTEEGVIREKPETS